MELADQGYRGKFRALGNAPGLDSGDVTVTLNDARRTRYTVPSSAATWTGEGIFLTLPDGRSAFYPAGSVLSVEDAGP